MIQFIIMILLLCLLLYVLYSGAAKDYKISPYDLNKEGLIKKVDDEDGDGITVNNENYKNFTHLFWFKIRYPESGRLLKHNSTGVNDESNENKFIIDFHKNNAVLDISLFDSIDTSTPHLHIERTNFPMNTWVFVAIVMEGDTLDLYLQGKLYDTRQTASLFVNSTVSWSDVVFGRDALPAESVNFSKNNANLSAYRFIPYQYSQENINKIFKDEYPIYYNNENIYEINLKLAKNGSTSTFSI